jgi:hypothetical protein
MPTDSVQSDLRVRKSQIGWDWHPPDSVVEKRSSLKKNLAAAGVGWAVALGFTYSGHHRMAVAVAVVASLLLLVALFWPWGHRQVDAAMVRFAGGVGVILNWILLTPFYYLFFTLIRGFRLVAGKPDALQRELASETESYWSDRDPIDDVKSHLTRQF